jgi:hypothetical protein
MHEQSLQLAVNEYNTTDLRVFCYSMTFMQFLSTAEARFGATVSFSYKEKILYL